MTEVLNYLESCRDLVIVPSMLGEISEDKIRPPSLLIEVEGSTGHKPRYIRVYLQGEAHSG